MNYRSVESARLLGIGIVSIVVVAVAASTIQSVTATGASTVTGPGVELPTPGGGGYELPDTGVDTDFPTGDGDPGGLVADVQACIVPLTAWYGALVYFGAFGGVLYLVERTYSFGAAVLGAYAVAPVAFLGYFLATSCPPSAGGGPGGFGGGGGGPGGGGPLGALQVSPVAAVAVFGLVLAAVADVLYRASGDQTVTALGEDDEGERDPADVADLAAAAGEAADRIEQYDEDVDNAVYRAWWEMTSMLAMPNPDSATPGQFADAAVDLGMDECDVERLTELFEEVRYGRRDAASREERALDVLRNIEAEYGNGGDTPDDATEN